MKKILTELKKKEDSGDKICIALIGCGQMGSSIVAVSDNYPGLDVKLVADLEVERGIEVFEEIGYKRDQIKICNQRDKAQKALEKGKVVVTEDAYLSGKIPAIDTIVEATGSTEVGAKVAYKAILQQKHIIMLNVETDVTVGWLLKNMADRAGVVYTVSAGDEPGAVMELYRLARTMGFQVTALGKGKNNPVDYYVTPEDVKEEAKDKEMNPKMLCAFIDGTKTMVEMAEVSNATGALPDLPGMHGPKVDKEDLNKKFIPKRDGGIFNNDFVVDYSTGKVSPGVFVIFTTDSEHLKQNLSFYSMGEGPYYTLFRPYHLCSIETPVSVARACITGEHTINSEEFNSEVAAIAKRDLSEGDVVQGIGSKDVFGRTYSYKEAQDKNALPLGVSQNCQLKNEINKGELITYDDVELDSNLFVVKLRGIQDSLKD